MEVKVQRSRSGFEGQCNNSRSSELQLHSSEGISVRNFELPYNTYYKPMGDPPYISSEQGGGVIMRTWLIS